MTPKGGGARVLGDRAGRGCRARSSLPSRNRTAMSPEPRRRLSAPCGYFSRRPTGRTIVSGGVLSPDGESLTFVARDIASGETALWVRALRSSALKRIEQHRRCRQTLLVSRLRPARFLHQRRAQDRRPARRPRPAGRVRRHQRRRRNLGTRRHDSLRGLGEGAVHGPRFGLGPRARCRARSERRATSPSRGRSSYPTAATSSIRS